MSSVMEIAMKEMGQLIELAQANLKVLPGPIVNVSGYGAVGDGVTNDTAVVQTAINYAIANGMKAVFFPRGKSGQYYVTALTNANQVVLFGDNASFVGGYTGTILQIGASGVSQSVFDALQAETTNVKRFGAVGNGVTDDTAAFQAAINSLPSGFYHTIHIASGSYLISGILNAGTKALQWVAEQGTVITGTLPGAVLEPFKGLMLSLPQQSAEGSGWRFEVRRTLTPFNYASGSQAVMVVQNEDKSNLTNNQFSPSIEFDFWKTGNGYVDAANRFSGSIWQGLNVTQDNTGDGSAHCVSTAGQLKAVGPGGYNELGLFVGSASNIASTKGTISGVELLLSDGVGSGVGQNFDTAMSAVIARVRRWNSGAQPTNAFVASSEGTVRPTAILTTNKAGFNNWQAGIDFTGATFTSGRAIILPNNSFVNGINTDNSISILLGVGSSNQTTLAASTDAGGISMINKTGTTLMSLDNDANNPLIIKVNGGIARVVTGAVDSGGVGFRTLRVAN